MHLSAQEADHLAAKNSDRARKIKRVGRTFLVPHKFSPSGQPLTEETFVPGRDLSKLSMDDFCLLDALQECGWNVENAAVRANMPSDEAKRRYKRLRYFEFEVERSQALAVVATPEFITAKHVDNVYTNTLDDGQRDSLKELTKILGLNKQTVVAQTNIFNMPTLTPEQEAQLQEIGDSIAMKKSAVLSEALPNA